MILESLSLPEVGGIVRLACRAGVAVVIGALMVVSLAACDSGGSDRDPVEIDGSSTAEDYDPTALPERPDDVNTDEGAYAFAAYIVELIDYAFATADAEVFVDLVPDGEICELCVRLTEILEQPQEQYDRVEVVLRDEPTRVEDPRLLERDDQEVSVAYTVVIPPGRTVNSDTGEVLSEGDESTTEEILVRMVWSDGRWGLLGWEFYQLGEIEEQYS